MKYLILALCFGLTLGLEFDRPCRDDVAAKENFSPIFVSLVLVFLKSVNNLKNFPIKKIVYRNLVRTLQQS